MAKRTSIIKGDIKFNEEIKDIITKRLRTGRDNIKPKSKARITLAITRHPLFPKIKQDIIISDLP